MRGFSWEKCKGWLLFEDQFISSVVVIGGATRYWHKNRSLWGDINLILPRKRAQPSDNSIPRCKFHHCFYLANQHREKERIITRSLKFFNSCEFLSYRNWNFLISFLSVIEAIVSRM